MNQVPAILQEKVTTLKQQWTLQTTSSTQTTVKIRGIEDVLKVESAPLAEFASVCGKNVAMAAVVKLVGNAIKFFSVGRAMDSAQLVDTAELILDRYWFLKIEDFQLFFKRLKFGDYGESFDRMDGNVILIALKKYVAERLDLAEKLSTKLHEEQKKAGEDCFYLVKAGDYFIRQVEVNQDGKDLVSYEQIENGQIASNFDYKSAVKLIEWLGRVHGQSAKLIDGRVSVFKLNDYLAKEKPELLSDREKHRRAKDIYNQRKKEIETDETLNDEHRAQKLEELVRMDLSKEVINLEDYLNNEEKRRI